MRNRKLFHLLALLNENDKERFTLFIRSPYFNTNKPLILFWDRLQEFDAAENFSKEAFLEGTALKASRFDNYCSQLFLQVQAFLRHEGLADNSRMKYQLLSQAILKRDTTLQAYQRFIPQIEDLLEKSPDSAEKYLSLFYFKAETLMAKAYARKMDGTWAQEFFGLQDILKRFFLTKSLQLSCGVENLRHVFAKLTTDSITVDAEIIEKPDPQKLGILPKIYFYTRSLQTGAEAAISFQTVLAMLREHRPTLSEDVAQEIYKYILNHCLRQLNAGDDSFIRHTYDLYLLLLENEDILEDGLLSPLHFKNIVSLGCRLGDREWVAEFIAAYAARLSDDHQGTAEIYNKAVLAFHQGHFPTAIGAFRKIIFEPTHDVFYGLDARIYLWKSYFEHRERLEKVELDEMYRLYDSFRLYVDRNPHISEKHRLQYRNFIRLFKRFTELIQLPKDNKRQKALVALELTVDSEPNVSNKTWFTQRIKQALRSQ